MPMMRRERVPCQSGSADEGVLTTFARSSTAAIWDTGLRRLTAGATLCPGHHWGRPLWPHGYDADSTAACSVTK